MRTGSATRAEGLERLAAFVPRAGRDYAAGRNTDPGPARAGAVSRLSAYLRYRLLTEQEVVAAVLARHGLPDCDSFVQEVLWRTYWKGWLELRPAVWSGYLVQVRHQRAALSDQCLLAQAEGGRTGIEGFDDWARELVATGHLHNHARMWFASIWIFTLRLPWALGADFFLRHLIDADPASNTLSWRWVAGLHTAGKTYLATTDNIARHTGGRFAPRGLAVSGVVPAEEPPGPPQPLADCLDVAPADPALLLVTHEDLHPESLFAPDMPVVAAVVARDPGLLWGERARDFAGRAADDAAARLGQHFGCAVDLHPELTGARLIAAAGAAGVRRIVTAQAPVGPAADALVRLRDELARAGITRVCRRRDWDGRFWPHATRGFFPFKARIPAELRDLGLV